MASDVRRKTIEMVIRVLDDAAQNAKSLFISTAAATGVSYEDVDVAAVKATVHEIRRAVESLLSGVN